MQRSEPQNHKNQQMSPSDITTFPSQPPVLATCNAVLGRLFQNALVSDVFTADNAAFAATSLRVTRDWVVPRDRLCLAQSQRTQEDMDCPSTGTGLLWLERSVFYCDLLLVHPNAKTLSPPVSSGRDRFSLPTLTSRIDLSCCLYLATSCGQHGSSCTQPMHWHKDRLVRSRHSVNQVAFSYNMVQRLLV